MERKLQIRARWLTALILLALLATPVLAAPPEPGTPQEPLAPAVQTKIYLPLTINYSIVSTGEDVPIPGLNNQFEPTVAAVNPLNPHNVAVASATELSLSTDFGTTFPTTVLAAVPPGLTGNTNLNGDDSLAFDAQGRLFWSYLASADTNMDGTRDDLTVVVQQVNPTTGAFIGNAADLTPGNLSDDKNWIAADANPMSPFANNLYVVWTRFNADGSEDIMFSRSVDQGVNWSAPAVISQDADGFVWPSHVAVAPNGDVYVAFHTQTCDANGVIRVLRDSNGGADLVAGTFANIQTSSFASAITCNVQSAAATAVPRTDFWMQGANGMYILPDPLRAGRIYIVANDDPDAFTAATDPGNVILATSTDDGATWTVKTISHAPNLTLQVMPVGAIDQDGNLMVHWYDTRSGQTNAGGNLLLDVYATVSRDGGATWSQDFRINDARFDPDLNAPCRFGPAANCGGADTVTTTRIGEYNGAAAANGIGYAAWTGNNITTNNQQTFFDVFSILGYYPDTKEPNNAANAGIATNLGAQATYNLQNLTIHSATDEDFFKVVALSTGKLTFRMDNTGRVADLDIQAQDKYNPVTPPSVINTVTDNLDPKDQEVLSIPVVAGETYFLRVFAQPGQAHPYNTYSLDVVNMPVPTPTKPKLAPQSDSGRDDQDNYTNIAQATIEVLVDQVAIAGLNFSPPNGTATLTDDDPGYKVAIYRAGLLAGYATPAAGKPGTFEFTFSAGEPLYEGLNSLTARVIVVDPSNNPATPQVDHVVAEGFMSPVGYIILDTTPPPTPSVPDLLAAADSGASDTDNVTNVNPPAFGGTAEANSLIRLFANDELVGEGTVGSDATDGVLGNNLGAWEVTIEPLADGTYDITAQAEDKAGNLSPKSAAMNPPLVIDTPDGGGMPQRPTLDLLDSFDTGRSDKDNITKLTTLDFRVSAEEGSTVVIKDGNTVIDTFVMPAGGWTIRTLELAEGPHPLSTESTDLAGNTSHQSEELHVTVDITAPATPAAPDLQSSSDTGGITIDNITSIVAPTFEGAGENNVIVRLYADNLEVGQGVMSSYGLYQVTAMPLNDDVYDMTVDYEDLAGNVSLSSPALKVTIAKYVLNLPGETTGPADADVVVDLNVGTITGFPGVPGGVIGVVGIPRVNLDANGKALTFLGSLGDDVLDVTPNGEQSGELLNRLNGQLFSFTGVAGNLLVDSRSGVDEVTVVGTADVDTVAAEVNTTSWVMVNALKQVMLATDSIEKMGIASKDGVDTIDVLIYDTVNALLFVDGGQPKNVSQKHDTLNLHDGVGNGQYRNLSGGPNTGAGSIELRFVKTTGNVTRIDYTDIEKLTWE